MTDKQLGIDFDACKGRHGGNAESEDAHEDTKPHKERLHADILAHVAACGAHGATAHEIAAALDIYLQTSSARCSELKAAGKLFKVGRRETQTGSSAAVLVTAEYFPEPSAEEIRLALADAG